MAETCLGCVHKLDINGELRCVRYPPQTFWIDGEQVSTLPIVHQDFLCGEFKRYTPPKKRQDP